MITLRCNSPPQNPDAFFTPLARTDPGEAWSCPEYLSSPAFGNLFCSPTATSFPALVSVANAQKCTIISTRHLADKQKIPPHPQEQAVNAEPMHGWRKKHAKTQQEKGLGSSAWCLSGPPNEFFVLINKSKEMTCTKRVPLASSYTEHTQNWCTDMLALWPIWEDCCDQRLTETNGFCVGTEILPCGSTCHSTYPHLSLLLTWLA